MPNPLSYSMIEEFKNNEHNKKKNNSIESKKKTRKNRTSMVNKKVEQFLESLNEHNDNDSETEAFTDFKTNEEQHSEKLNNNPYRNPISVYNQQMEEKENQQHNENHNDERIGQEEFNTIQNNNYQQYYDSYVPYSNNVTNQSNISGQKDMLIEKLNYMIHLLEEQQEEKTGHVTEELILYSFLGVFVIFVIDSFARAGKYVR